MKIPLPEFVTRPPYSYLFISLGIVVLIGAGITVGLLTRQQPQSIAVEVTPSASPTTTPSPSATPIGVNWLTRKPVSDESLLTRRPLAVMIENHPDARPQAGLADADLVYEAIAEGGITRFMAVFSDPTKSYKVGPIRSARTYYVDYATELGALFAHVGGNMDALDQIKATKNFYDLDQFAVGSPVFARDPSRNVATEHTMFSTTNGLWEYAVTKAKYPATTETAGQWKTANELPLSDRPTTLEVAVNFSSASFATTWTYNRETNTFLRTMAGSAHRDATSSAQIEVSTLILQTVVNTPTVTRINEAGWKYTLTGSGKAVIIQNGTTTDVTWKKEGTERTRYYDSAGAEVGIIPGKTWVSIIHANTPVTYR